MENIDFIVIFFKWVEWVLMNIGIVNIFVFVEFFVLSKGVNDLIVVVIG